METHINALYGDVDQAEVELVQAKSKLAGAKARLEERKAQDNIEDPTPADNEALNERAVGESYDVRVSEDNKLKEEKVNARRSRNPRG